MSISTAASPTAAKAIERRRAFQQSIADAAERLKETQARAASEALRRASYRGPYKRRVLGAPAEAEKPAAPVFDRFLFVREVNAPPVIRHPAVAEIQKAVAVRFRVTKHDMCSKRRTKEVVRPRQIAAYLCKELTLLSYPQIGRLFGNRDHTTILHAWRKISKLVRADEDTAFEVALLIEEITGIQQ